MISKLAPPITDTATVAPTAAVDAADSGVFDVLMSLQSLAGADAAAVSAQQAVPIEGTDVLAGMLEDSTDETTDLEESAESAEGALWFLNTMLPAPKVPVPDAAAAGAASAAANIQADTPLTAAPPQVAAQAASITDLAQAFAFGPATSEAADSRASAPNIQAGTTQAADTTTWNALNGPAEFFAHAKHGSAERVESATVTTHVRDPRWADDLGNRLASMVRTGESSASLQLTPVDLGPLEVNVSVRDNQATVHFGAANAETRALLEASIPRLREMLAAQGFALMDSSVSHGFARQTRHEAAGTPRVDALGESPSATAQPIHISGLLDLYA